MGSGEGSVAGPPALPKPESAFWTRFRAHPVGPGPPLAMQKVEGSNPFSRFDEAPLPRGFLRLGSKRAGRPEAES